MNKKGKYGIFLREALQFIPRERVYTDELRRLAWGTDAGFYRLVPNIVIRSDNETEISRLLRLANKCGVAVTFRAAGTSLSGQSVSDSVLIVAGKHWEKYSLSPDHGQITLQPGIIGQRVNQILAPFGKKFSPDPASIQSAMVGGIVMNNASGMNCGIHANSDKMMVSARIVLADGTILDTGDTESRADFEKTHADFLRRVCELRDKVRGNKALSDRIRYKYSIKNVTGLNILPFLRFDDPFDIIAHLMVGSEGTLAFLSSVTMRTENDYPFKASAMLYFKSIGDACRAVVAMRKLQPDEENAEENGGDASANGGENAIERRDRLATSALIKSAELLDYKSLSSVSDAVYLKYKSECADGDASKLTAVLTEVKGNTHEELLSHIKKAEECLADFDTYVPVYFTDKPEEYSKYWAIRSGIFPAVGGTRKKGTTCLIEDVAFHIEDLPEATANLQQLIARHGYDDACIYGHALEGNYHFIINQSFSNEQEVKRYSDLMEDVKHLVIDKYDGSLKAEHGTGRNMAPFVGYEWGEEAFALMKEVKRLFDPNGLLNPGVIFNDDPQCHLRNFKPLPLLQPDERNEANEVIAAVYEKLNKCIECGFCEVNCVSCGFTMSSRQRIVIQREMSRLRQSGEDDELLSLLEKQYSYLGNQTCAGDGLCSMSCPMGINVGELTHIIRQQSLPQGGVGYRIGDYAARHLAFVCSCLRKVLAIANIGHAVLGTRMMTFVTRKMHDILSIPLWTPAMPLPFKKKKTSGESSTERPKVVYFPSCINQTMGLPRHSTAGKPLVDKMLSLLRKAGYDVIFPEGMENLCCGTIWESKGMMDIADKKTKELEEALWKASAEGEYPVLCDQSPCLYRMKERISRMKLYEPAEFITKYLCDRLTFTPTDRPIAVHVTCSMRKMGLADTIIQLARRCSTNVVVPEGVGCCAFAGDKGFTHPELNAYALRKLRPQIQREKVVVGYSNSRTCEIGLTTNSGVPYMSIAYLVDECTKPKAS